MIMIDKQINLQPPVYSFIVYSYSNYLSLKTNKAVEIDQIMASVLMLPMVKLLTCYNLDDKVSYRQ